MPHIEVAVEVAQEREALLAHRRLGSVMTHTCSAGYSETDVPASRASSEVQSPAARTTVSASIVAPVGLDAGHRAAARCGTR